MKLFSLLVLVPLLALSEPIDQDLEYSDSQYPLHEAAQFGEEKVFQEYIEKAKEEDPNTIPALGMKMNYHYINL